MSGRNKTCISVYTGNEGSVKRELFFTECISLVNWALSFLSNVSDYQCCISLNWLGCFIRNLLGLFQKLGSSGMGPAVTSIFVPWWSETVLVLEQSGQKVQIQQFLKNNCWSRKTLRAKKDKIWGSPPLNLPPTPLGVRLYYLVKFEGDHQNYYTWLMSGIIYIQLKFFILYFANLTIKHPCLCMSLSFLLVYHTYWTRE